MERSAVIDDGACLFKISGPLILTWAVPAPHFELSLGNALSLPMVAHQYARTVLASYFVRL